MDFLSVYVALSIAPFGYQVCVLFVLYLFYLRLLV